MKALVYTGTRQIEIQDIPKPESGDDGVIVKVAAAGICGSEVEAYLGRSRKRVPPLVMGHEFTGTVDSVGEAVDGVSVGDRVVVQPLFACGECPECLTGRSNICRNRKLMSIEIPGGYAEYAAVPASALFDLPEAVPFEVGILAEPLSNGVHILERTDYRILERLVVLGGGTIGALVMMAARAIGITNVVVTEPNPARRQKLAQLGAEFVLDPFADDALQRVLDWSGGGADVVVDASGAAQARKFAVECVHPGATIVLVGQGSGASDADHRDILTKELVIKGSYGYTDDDFARAIQLLASGRVDGASIVRSISMEESPAAFAQLADDAGADIKLVMAL